MCLPSLLKVVEESTFYGCEHLKSVQFPDCLETIGPDAFFNAGLESVELPASLRTVAQGAFAECKCLRTAVLNEGLEVLGTDD